MEKKIPTMTIGQDPQEMELQKLRAENDELKARCAAYEEKLRNIKDDCERAYMRGRIDGLKFSIRCNGVSGDEVKK